jgi:hypothetical protein
MPSTVRWILTCRSYSLWGKLNTKCPLRVLRFCIPWAADFKRIMVTNICMGIVTFWTLFSYTTGNTRGSWGLYWPLQDNKIQMSKKLKKKVPKMLWATFKAPKLIGWNKTENKDKYGMSLKSCNPKFKGKYFDISIRKFLIYRAQCQHWTTVTRTWWWGDAVYCHSVVCVASVFSTEQCVLGHYFRTQSSEAVNHIRCTFLMMLYPFSTC